MTTALDTAVMPRYLESYRHDGIEITRRRRRKTCRRKFSLPLQQLMQFALVVMAFKAFLFVELGVGGYGAKIEVLAGGNAVERVAAKMMVLDPVSAGFGGAIAGALQSVL